VRKGEENTSFFHASASSRHRQNQIRCLEVGDGVTVAHADKAAALHEFYVDLLGRARPTVWIFDLAQLYSGSRWVNGPRLVAPFSEAELLEAVTEMDRSSSPGPDGLGPSFFQAAWPMVKADVMQLDLININRAHIISF
jgi:hypothetical protein